MLATLVSWPVVATIVALSVGIAFAVLSMTPPRHRIAEVCFCIAAVLLIAKVTAWIVTEKASVLERLLVTFLVFGVIGVGWSEAMRWVESMLPPKAEQRASASKVQNTAQSVTSSSTALAEPRPKPASETAVPTTPRRTQPTPQNTASPRVETTQGQQQIVPRHPDRASKPGSSAIVTRLAEFIDEATAIQNRFIATNDAKRQLDEGNEWATRVSKYLAENLDVSYASQFRNAHGSAWMGMPNGRSVEGGGYWQTIEGKKNCLNEFIGELRRSKQP